MANLSPKIEIITHFDELINNVDIDCETSIQKYKEKQVLSQLYSKDDNEKYWKKVRFKLGFTSESFHNNEETSANSEETSANSEETSANNEETSVNNEETSANSEETSFNSEETSANSEETSVIEYLKHVRKKAIKELKQTQTDSLDYYKLNYLLAFGK